MEATRRITAAGFAKNPPAVILMSAFGGDGAERVVASSAGAAEFLMKPITASTLADAIIRIFAPDLLPEMVQRQRESEASKGLRGARVLLAEDNEINQQIAVELLQGAGVEVVVASNGREAIEKLAAPSARFDMVLMDIQMPDVDGYEATRRIRAQPWGASLPIIAMTAHALEEERRKALETGMDSHISKPIDPDVMFETMRQFYHPAGSARAEEQIAAPRHGEASFPSMEGVDVTAGLRRVAGNTRLYRELLKRFVDGQESCALDIGKALEAGDAGLAEMRAHTLSGIAGTLGVNAVWTAAAEVEKQLREKDPAERIEETRIRLDVALRAAVNAVRSMLGHGEAVRDGDVPGRPPGDPNAALEKLSRLVEGNDIEALEIFDSLRTTWEAIAGRGETKVLADLLAAYDFAAALPRVRLFQQKMRTSQGEGKADVGVE
jgi:CheY-like chemotaxis protein